MYPKLLSTAHIKAASLIFPEKITSGWCDTQWTDEEINECKSWELQQFLKDPRSINYPGLRSLENVSQRDELKILDEFIGRNKNIKTMLSVGCGLGEKEIFLAKKYPNIQILCIDNAPYLEQLNYVMHELGLPNIVFRNHDLRDGSLGQFDLVFSMSVIYCIPEEALENYFSILNESKVKGGAILVGCTSNLSPVLGIHLIIKNKLIDLGILSNPVKTMKVKQTGWIRPVKFLIQRIPRSLKIVNVFYTHHYDNNYPILLNLMSKKILPLTN